MFKEFIQKIQNQAKGSNEPTQQTRPHFTHIAEAKRASMTLSQEKNIYTREMLTAGAVLKKKRLELGLSVKRVALDTKIQERYISAIEENELSALQNAVYINGFIKIYADYLELDVEKVSALYRRSIGDKDNKSLIKTDYRPTGASVIETFLTPTNVIISLGILFLLAIGLYISIQFYSFSKAPELTISTPKNGITVTQSEIEIKGKAETDTLLTINDKSISYDKNGNFTQKLSLNAGLNTVNIKATKKSNQNSTTVKSLTITYSDAAEPVTETPVETPVVPVGFTAKLEIKDAEVWILFSVDQKQQVAQILSPGYSQEFPFTKEIYISTGKPGNTFLYVNGVAQQLNINSDTGTAKLTCTVKNTSFSCK